jgi:hypothetical protein
MRIALGKLGQPDHLQQLAGALLPQAARLALKLEAKSHVLQHRPPRQQRILLEDETPIRAWTAGRGAIHQDAAAGGRLQAIDDAQQRRLARAARAHDAHKFTRLNREIDRAQCFDSATILRAKPLRQASDLQLRGHRMPTRCDRCHGAIRSSNTSSRRFETTPAIANRNTPTNNPAVLYCCEDDRIK